MNYEAHEAAPTRYELVTGSDLLEQVNTQWVVHGLIPDKGLVAIYGASMSGKSFLTLDLAFAVASGADWFHRRTRAARVVYFPLEGARNCNRNIAWTRHNKRVLPVAYHEIKRAPLDLMSETDVQGVIDVVKGAPALPEEWCGTVVIIDTLARASAGVDENSASDMGEIVRAAEKIAAELGGVVVLVHHTGKDGTRGMRGSTALIGAVDAAIEVNRSGSRRSWTAAKVKDGDDGGEEHFTLQVVEWGADDFGKPFKSCVVLPCSSEDETSEPGGKNQAIVLEALRRALLVAETGVPYAPPDKQALRARDAAMVGKAALSDAGVPKAASRYAEVMRSLLRAGTLKTAGPVPHSFAPDKPDKVIWQG